MSSQINIKIGGMNISLGGQELVLKSTGSHSINVPNGLYVGSGLSATSSTLAAQEVYDGGFGETTEVRLRIANGGAGQSGLIGEWANAFIQHMVFVHKVPPFKVAWYLGDTTQSLGLLAAGEVDIAVTYNEAAEKQSLASGNAAQSVYGFRDHFMLVGPKTNPAGLNPQNDDILAMFNKLVTVGNVDAVIPPANRPPVRFLSRYDKSATNIKESQLFITIGQVPWALAYSNFYHQYPRFPLQALHASAVLEEYTLTDYGTWLSSSSDVTNALVIYQKGTDDADDLLLNPGHVLLGTHLADENANIARYFMQWVADSDGGQKVIANFKKSGQVLYSQAPL
ncbi:hypothetical protein Clacol_001388 [Clathrus columnatus]|uniref:PBP domain-containing protein n=1 Tax=Clathrus columnatus TaxID=1419009 RepID=A0AAV5A131_9AGAM|nr:hypothetical protein Clacol_001388 [Clathrus columnatus]